jgi:hypothetical protein
VDAEHKRQKQQEREGGRGLIRALSRMGCLTFILLWVSVGMIGCLSEMYDHPKGPHEHRQQR